MMTMVECSFITLSNSLRKISEQILLRLGGCFASGFALYLEYLAKHVSAVVPGNSTCTDILSSTNASKRAQLGVWFCQALVVHRVGKDGTMKQPSTQERRTLKRRSLSYYMLVMDANTQETLGHLVDITPKGLLMDCPKPLPLEKNFRLRLETMPDVADKAYIVFTARTKWCLPDVIEPYLYDVGFSIVDIGLHDAEIVQRITEKYASRDGNNFH